MNDSKFWKMFFGSGSVTLFNAFKAFVINKLLAVFLPPAAFACVAQFLNLMMVGEATSSLAMQNGWVSLTAQNRENTDKLLAVWHGGFRITTIATILTCVFAVIFCFVAPLHLILPGVPTRLAQAAILFALPGMLATNIVSICAAVMNGLGQMRLWASINIVSALWQMLWVAFFLYTGHLSVLSVVATQSIIAAFFALQVARKAGFSFNRIRKMYSEIRKPWLSYAAMGIVPMILTPLVLTFVRSYLGASLGWNAAGMWQGVYKISDFFASIYSAILGVILLPKVSANLSKVEFKKIFNPLFVRLVGVSLVLVILIYACRDLVVSLFLSGAYIGVSDYMGFQLVGDFFRSAGWCFGFVLIARKETKAFLSIEIASQLLFALATVVGVQIFEFSAPMISYAVENILTTFALAFVVLRLKWRDCGKR
ncbi:MAG: O-antigen translocase [Fibrobacteraceae bacterium]|nr:O-antigen translocase [Fibrobacteraceae bacterium]